MANDAKRSFQLLVLITTPKLADTAANLLRRDALPIQYRISAEGTASSDIMDMLGLGSVDKSILVSTIPKHYGEDVLDRLHGKLRLNTVNSGIAFTIPLTGASNLLLQLTQTVGNELGSEGKDEMTMTEAKHTLVAAVVNRGFSEDVMNAARAAGARGGTVIHSRCIGNEEATGVWGLSVQEEKEIILILSKAEVKLDIMRSITEMCGVNSKAQGVVFSLPVDSVMGL